MLDIPLPAFHMCALNAPLWTEWAYVASVGISGACPPRGRDCHFSLICVMTRLGGFHLYHRVHDETQDCIGPTAHIITSHEDLDPGLGDLFLYHADVQYHHVGVCSHGEGDSEEFPSRVSFCAYSSAIKRQGVNADSSMRFIHRAPVV